MLPDAPRRFTLIDAMVLVAAVGVSFVLIRDYVQDSRIARALSAALPDEWGAADLWRRATVYAGIISPLAVALSLALFVLRIRRPRPSLRQALRQPGMLASTVAVLGTGIFVAKVLLGEWYLYQTGTSMSRPLHWLWMMRLPWNGELVAVAWLLSWAGGLWRPEPSWIDRAGRILGAYWIASGVFCDYVLRF
jgi:hypothetical protein